MPQRRQEAGEVLGGEDVLAEEGVKVPIPGEGECQLSHKQPFGYDNDMAARKVGRGYVGKREMAQHGTA